MATSLPCQSGTAGLGLVPTLLTFPGSIRGSPNLPPLCLTLPSKGLKAGPAGLTDHLPLLTSCLLGAPRITSQQRQPVQMGRMSLAHLTLQAEGGKVWAGKPGGEAFGGVALLRLHQASLGLGFLPVKWECELSDC